MLIFEIMLSWWVLLEVGNGCVEVWMFTGGGRSVKAGLCLQGHGDDITGLSFSPDSAIVVSSSRDCSLRVWQVSTGDPASPPLPATYRPEQISRIDPYSLYSGDTLALQTDAPLERGPSSQNNERAVAEH